MCSSDFNIDLLLISYFVSTRLMRTQFSCHLIYYVVLWCERCEVLFAPCLKFSLLLSRYFFFFFLMCIRYTYRKAGNWSCDESWGRFDKRKVKATQSVSDMLGCTVNHTTHSGRERQRERDWILSSASLKVSHCGNSLKGKDRGRDLHKDGANKQINK